MNPHLERKSQHLRAREQMNAGLYAQAETILLDTLHQLGPHVGILSDLVVTSYLQNKMDHFEKHFETLQNEFAHCENKLSLPSFVNTQIILAKYFEEMCLIDKAVTACNRALTAAETLEQKKKIQIQKLRLLASLGPSAELSQIYAECNRVEHYSNHLQIELLHGLMLAEIHLIGFESAKKRLNQALESLSDEDQLDRCLLTADYLEQELLVFKKTELPVDLLNSLTQGDSFEKCLLAFVKNDFSEFELNQDKLTKMSWFRCAAIMLRLSTQENPELTKKFHLLLASVPASSHKLLSQKWPFIWKLETVREIILENDKVTHLHGEIKLGRKNNLKNTLEFFSLHNEASLQDFVEKALSEKHDAYSFDQVRMIFARIQKDFAQNFGIISPVFQVTKDRVWKNPNLKLTRKS